MRRTIWIVLALALGLSIAGCGDGGDDAAAGFSFGAVEYALPFLPGLSSTEAPVYGFKNLTGSDATIMVGAFTPGGVPYPGGMIPVLIPARGETRLPLGAIAGGPSLGGWVAVDTTGVAAGFIVPYVDRFVIGGKRSAEKALAYRSGTVCTTLSPFATAYELINHSDKSGVPFSVTYDIVMYDASGVPTMSTMAVAGDATMRVPVTPGTIGLVCATPVGPFAADETIKSAITARESGVPVHSESRYRNATDTRLDTVPFAFELEFGREGGAAGNVNDFAVLLSNPGTELETMTISAIYRANGTTILGTPRFVTIDPKATKFLATRTIDSFGLDLGGGEVSPFDDLFGDVSLASGVTSFTLLITVPDTVDVSARHYDRLFGTYCRLVPPRPLTGVVNVCNLPIQTTTSTGTRTYVDLMNPTPFELTVFVRGFTPGGTEYLLDPVVVPGLNRVRWSQDGTIFREDPFDVLLPPVLFMSFEFTSTGGMHVGARTEVRDTFGVFTNQVPIIVRNLAFE